jgi:hypothetical protein
VAISGDEPNRNESNVLFARRKEPLLVNSRVTGQLVREMQVKEECSEGGGDCNAIAYFGAKLLLLAQHAVEIGLDLHLH